MLTMLKRDAKIIGKLYQQGATVKAVCQISKIDPKANYTNVAIQKVYFTVNGNEYFFDHVWLQGRDYERTCKELSTLEEGTWMEIEFKFYEYRDKITKTERGRMMHGLTVSNYKVLDQKETEKNIGSKFYGMKNVKFVPFKINTSMWMY